MRYCADEFSSVFKVHITTAQSTVILRLMLTAEQGITASRALSSVLDCLTLPELDHGYHFNSSAQQSTDV